MLHEGNNLTTESFQKEIDAHPKGQVMDLFPHEFPGPIIVNRKLVIDGHGATIWALKGPVVIVQSPGVTLRNLRIEVTADQPQTANDEDCALAVQSGLSLNLENVEVRGAVAGLVTEEGAWQYPYSIDLGCLEHLKEYDFRLRIFVPVPSRIASAISGLDVTPLSLPAGKTEVHLKLSPLSKDALLHGHLTLDTSLLRRRITITGRVWSGASGNRGPLTASDAVLWQAADWDTPTLSEVTPSSVDVHTANAAEPLPATQKSGRKRRGNKKSDPISQSLPAAVLSGDGGSRSKSSAVLPTAVGSSSPTSPAPAGSMPDNSVISAAVPPPPTGETAGSPEPQPVLTPKSSPRPGSKSAATTASRPGSMPVRRPGGSAVLTATPQPREGGKIQGAGKFAAGNYTRIQAEPNPRYRFDHWSGDLAGTDNPAMVHVNSDMNVIGHFEKMNFDLIVAAEPDKGGQVDGAGIYAKGDKVTVQAKENPKWRFDRWSGDLSGTTNPVTVQIDKDKTITAYFEKTRVMLTTSIDPAGGGKVAGAGEYARGDSVRVRAEPNPRWRFDRWSGDAAGTDNPCSLSLDDDKRITAKFVKIRSFALTTLAVKGGTVQGGGTCDEGKTVTLKAVAKAGWRFANWDGAVTGTTNPVSVTVDQDKTVTAQFIREGTPKQWVLSAVGSPWVVIPVCSALTLADALWVSRKAIESSVGVPFAAVAALALGLFGAVSFLRRLVSGDQ